MERDGEREGHGERESDGEGEGGEREIRSREGERE